MRSDQAGASNDTRKPARRGVRWIAGACALVLAGSAATAQQLRIEVLPELPVHAANLSLFATPIAESDQGLYLATVQPPASEPESGVNLRTMVHHAVRLANGEWRWGSYELDRETIEDPYHAQPSVGADRRGHVHVAYNMHNMPWQYSRTRIAGDITSMTFRGEPLSIEQKKIVRHENRTPFRAPSGAAALPGTQITYPAFFNDRAGALYLTYRFATRPELAWPQRAFAAGVARYDEQRDAWIDIGVELRRDPAELPSPRAFALADGWTPYLVRLAFDADNSMHAAWSWAQGGPQRLTQRPSYVRLHADERAPRDADGTRRAFPLAPTSAVIAEKVTAGSSFFAGVHIALDSKGRPHVLLQSADGPRQLTTLDQERGWSAPESLPDGAAAIIIDEQDRMWAVATGPRIFVRSPRSRVWRLMHAEKNWCYPKLHRSSRGDLWLHMQRCDLGSVRVVRLEIG